MHWNRKKCTETYYSSYACSVITNPCGIWSMTVLLYEFCLGSVNLLSGTTYRKRLQVWTNLHYNNSSSVAHVSSIMSIRPFHATRVAILPSLKAFLKVHFLGGHLRHHVE